MEQLLFYIFSIFALLSAVMVIAAHNPIHSILFLILVFCNAAGLVLLLEAEFLAMLFLIVYVGAIAVLFLFVVMLLDIKGIELTDQLIRYIPAGSIIAALFFLEIFVILKRDFGVLPPSSHVSYTSFLSLIDSLSNVNVIGEVLYTYYVFPFIMASFVLLIALVAAIALTLEKQAERAARDAYRTLYPSIRVSLYK